MSIAHNNNNKYTVLQEPILTQEVRQDAVNRVTSDCKVYKLPMKLQGLDHMTNYNWCH